ncbi:DUF2959 domain-containing protein [Parvularcula sp. LCG005]|uniref:DUF2959 domain-containing protein n=1 Tax=Parvularcula sp. LCG005 TaxID=3078805 RepID=UPI002943469F|nr:DUF2959 domain-containing protein [Parvularcula sp. LCG005]WOI52073.1 DUF2959 domain-containing protein [Parvularcula sp. LCG005]
MKLLRALPIFAVLTLTACSTVYYEALENVGIEKRDVLVDRVDDGRKAQTDAQKEFKNGLERFRTVVAFDGGDLERKYNKLSSAYDRMESEAGKVSDRIDSIEDVGKALFREWEAELDQYQDQTLKAQSAAQLRETRAQYNDVVTAMHRAEDRMGPVLGIFNDQVLFLKHNLNAQAIASLEAEQIQIEARVNALLAEMDAAIAEANSFISRMRS